MSYYDTVEEGSRWSRATVVRELRRHGLSVSGEASDFAELGGPDGPDGDYDAWRVIAWLGY